MTHKEFLKDLRTTAWRTSGARFNAWRRLKRRDFFATFSIALFAALGSGLAVIQRIYEFKAGTALDNYVTALSVLIGFFVIIISLIEWGYGGAQRGEALFRNAERLGEFQRKLGQELSSERATGEGFAENAITSHRQEYEEIKRLCPYNHDPIDDDLFRAEKPDEFKDAPRGAARVWVYCRYQLSSVLYFGVFWIIIGLLLWAMPWATMPKGTLVQKSSSQSLSEQRH